MTDHIPAPSSLHEAVAAEGRLSDLSLKVGDVVQRLTGHDRYSEDDIGTAYEVKDKSGYWGGGLHLVARPNGSGWTTMMDLGRFRVIYRAAPVPQPQTSDRRRPFKHLDDTWTEVPCLINPEPVSHEVREIRDAPLSISFFQDCGHSPAWQMIPTVLVELDQAGLGFHPYQGPVWNDPCLISHDQTGKPTGFLVYRYNSERSSWFVMLAYVIPEARRQGIHTALFQGLVERARKRGDILMIESGTHIDNTRAQAAFEAQGRKKVAISYEYRLLDWLPGKSHLDLEQEAGP